MEIENRSKKIKIVAVVLILALIVGGGFLIVRGKYLRKESQIKTSVFNNYNKNEDSDNDGLLDWEEILLKTDPENPDTDGDGFLDGEEVNSSHNPLVKAPGDEIIFDNSDISNSDLQGNLTEKLSQSILTKIIQETNPNQEYTEEDLENLINPNLINSEGEILNNFFNNAILDIDKLLSIDSLEIKDEQIKTIEDNSKEALTDYIQALNSILLKNFPLEHRIDIVNLFQNPSVEQSNIRASIEDYKKAISEIKNLTVPSSLKELHKQELAILLNSQKMFEVLNLIQEDPIGAYLAMVQLTKIFDQSLALGYQFEDLIKKENINF